jgi:hypothetical protein
MFDAHVRDRHLDDVEALGDPSNSLAASNRSLLGCDGLSKVILLPLGRILQQGPDQTLRKGKFLRQFRT